MKKRIVAMFLCFVLTLLCFSSCIAKAEDAEIEFSYSLNKKYFFIGDVIELTVTATNVGESCNYNDVAMLFGDATLRYASVHKEFTLSSEPVSVESEVSESIFKILKNGDRVEVVYRFTADEACPYGFYDIEFLFDGNAESYSKAVKITEEMTEEEAKIRDMTDNLFLEQYKDCPWVDNLCDFYVNVLINEKKSFANVNYILCIYGNSTNERVEIRVKYNPEDGSSELDDIDNMDLGVFSEHLHCFSEEDFLKVKEESPWGWLALQEGYLCFGYEQIIDITPPSPGESGCNIDHVHKVYYNRICQKPHNE